MSIFVRLLPGLLGALAAFAVRELRARFSDELSGDAFADVERTLGTHHRAASGADGGSVAAVEDATQMLLAARPAARRR